MPLRLGAAPHRPLCLMGCLWLSFDGHGLLLCPFPAWPLLLFILAQPLAHPDMVFCPHLSSPGHLPEVCHGPEKTRGNPGMTRAACILLDMDKWRESMGTHVTHSLTHESESKWTWLDFSSTPAIPFLGPERCVLVIIIVGQVVGHFYEEQRVAREDAALCVFRAVGHHFHGHLWLGRSLPWQTGELLKPVISVCTYTHVCACSCGGYTCRHMLVEAGG